MKKYDSYKDSGIEWIGEIPRHWEESKLKYLFSFSKGLTITKENLEDIGVPCVNYGEIHSHCGFKVNPEKNSLRCVSEDYLKNSTNSLMTNGDFVFADTSEDIEGSGNFTHLYGDRNVFAGYHTIVLKPSQKLNSKFFAYHFDSLEFRSQIRSTVKGIKVLSVTQSILKNCEVWIPPIEEQTAIANYLGQKTTQIDDLIAKKERLIQLLEEERTAIINQAVTKGLPAEERLKAGLDPNVPMKDSGIEWLGEIPEHWEVKRLKQIFNLSKGLTITKENLESEGIPCVNYGEIHSKFGFEVDINKHQLKCVNPTYLESDYKSLIRTGDFVFADTSEDISGAGNFTYLKSNHEIFAGYHTIILRPLFDIESRYFAYQFDSIPYRTQIRQSVKGIKVFSITQGILKNTSLWIPEIHEQRQIVEFLDVETNRIDTMKNSIIKEIELLKEYKTALISEVVTGKVKVVAD